MNTGGVNPNERDLSGLLLTEAPPSFPGHLGGIRLLKFTSDGRRFLSADLGMRFKQVENGRTTLQLELSSDGYKARAMDRIHDIAVADDGAVAFVAAGLHLRCLDLESGHELWRHSPRFLFGFIQTSPRAVGITKNKYVFVSNDSGTMELWRPEGKLVSQWRTSDAPNIISRLANGSSFVGTDGYGLTVWEPEDSCRTMKLCSSTRIYGLKAFPKSDKVVTRMPGAIGIFDLFAGSLQRTFHIGSGLPFVDVSPSGETLLYGQGRGVAVADVYGKAKAFVEQPGARILTAVFSPDGSHIVAGTDAGDVVQFDVP